MARKARCVVPGYPHHLIQRGNNRAPVFTSDPERRRYLSWLDEAAREHGVALHAYVLMDNHVHLLATPKSENSLSRTMQSLGRRYVGWFNTVHGRTGTLWEGRFKLCLVDTDPYLLACQRYIELNPVRAGIVVDAGTYLWSSAAHHLGLRTDPMIADHPLFWQLGNTPFERQSLYRAWLDSGTAEAERLAIMGAVLSGKPLAGAELRARLVAEGGGPVAEKPRGRPRKTPVDSVPI